MTQATNLSTLIDQFGDLKAEMADLELRQKALKEALAELRPGAYEGERYRLNVIEADVERVDWKAIAEKLEPSRQLIAAHTSSNMVRSLRSGTRNGKKVAA